MGITKECFFGFSVTYTNSFSEVLERRARQLARSFREANLQFDIGLSLFHDAVDAALIGNAAGADAALQRGLDALDRSNEHLTALGDALVQTRADLFERQRIDPADPLIAREPCFAAIDYDELYGELSSRGATLPQRVFWNDVADRVRQNGSRAGLRLLERQVREVQSNLRSFAAKVQAIRVMPLRSLGPALHDVSAEVSAIIFGFTRFQTTITYFSVFCERATQLFERGLEDAPHDFAVAG